MEADEETGKAYFVLATKHTHVKTCLLLADILPSPAITFPLSATFHKCVAWPIPDFLGIYPDLAPF